MVIMMYGKKGANFIWVVMVAVVVLAATTALVRQPSVDKDVLKFQMAVDRVDNELQQSLDRAIDTAIQDFAVSGMSNLDYRWYANYPFPPGREEVIDALKTKINRNVDGFLDNLVDQQDSMTLKISEPVISLGPLDSQQQVVTVNNLEFLCEEADKSQQKDASQSFDYPYRWYLIYEVANEWMQSDAGDIRNQIKDLMDTACYTDACRCGEINFGPAPDNFLEANDVDEEDVFTVVDNAVNSLNSLFLSKGIQGISCSYQVKGDPITHSTVSVEASPVQRCIGSGEALNLHEEYFKTWLHQPELPNWEILGFQWQNPSLSNYREEMNLDVPDEFINIHDVVPMDRGDVIGRVPGGFVQYTLSIDKGVFLDMDITCQDALVQADTEEGTKPFTVKFGMLLSMFLGCGNLEPEGEPEGECFYGSGGSSAGGGHPGTASGSSPPGGMSG
ncbi:MAG: hypothetical protein ABIF10_00245 [Candidatus Woesearchaeota archaeon]